MNDMAANPLLPNPEPELAIIGILKESREPVSPRHLIEQLRNQFAEALIRQVIWQLLSDGEIELRGDRRLQLRRTASAGTNRPNR